MTDMTDFW